MKITKKCDTCVYFLKMKSLNDSRALCEFFDGRVKSSRSVQNCIGYQKPKYGRWQRVELKKELKKEIDYVKKN